MNNEEYKLEIIKQLRTPDSPMRCLMTQWKMRERKTKTVYRDYIEFSVNSIGLNIIVNKVDAGRDTCFAVQFAEGEPFAANYPNSYDLKSYSGATRFYFEKIAFSHNIIAMSIESFEIRTDGDILPYKTEINMRDIVIFHIDDLNWQSPKLFNSKTQSWTELRNGHSYGFVDYEYDGQAETQLKDFLEKSLTSTVLRDEILDIFANAIGDEQHSSMFYIASALKELFARQKKLKR